MDILEIEKIIKNFLDLSFIGLSFKLPVYTEGDFYIIGVDYEDKIGVSHSDHFVYSLSESTLFINSSLNQLIDCLLFFTKNFDFQEEYSDTLRLEKLKTIKRHFLKIDTPCLDQNTWWSYILEQVEEGYYSITSAIHLDTCYIMRNFVQLSMVGNYNLLI